jgi:uncharacterized membrane protein YhaH (DUF805 family)
MVPRESIYARYTCGRLGVIMNFGQAIASGFKNYIVFEGRACRSAYWFWALFVILASIATRILDQVLFAGGDVGILSLLFGLATFLPGLAVGIRRLHDIDKSGWWFLLVFIPLVGVIIILVWAATKGTEASNRFGSDPLALAAEQAPT